MTRPRSPGAERAAPSTAPARAARAAFPHGAWPRMWAPVALLLLTRGFLWFGQPLAGEDAYVTFRYAKMLIHGHGLVFNPGERVMGFTSLPWTLWCALGMALQIDPVGWTRFTSVGADLVTLLVGWELLASACSERAAWAFALFFAMWPYFAASAVSGMEPALLLAAILVAARLASARSRWTGVALGLVATLRPEGLVAAAVLAPGAGGRARLTAAGIVAATALGLAAYYGTPIPHSLVAKAILYGTPGPWAGRHWWEWVLPFPLGRFPAASEGQQLVPIAVVFSAALARGVVETWARRGAALARAAAAACAVWLGYAALGVAYFWWYLEVPLGGLGLLAAAGFPAIVRGRWIPIAALAFLCGAWTLAPGLYFGRAQAEFNDFTPVASYLEAHARPGETALLEPIGIVGYFTSVRVLDEAGLVSPEVLSARTSGAGWYAGLVARRAPEWLVVRHDEVWNNAAFAGEAPPFRDAPERDATFSRYRLELPADPASGRSLEVYRRVR